MLVLDRFIGTFSGVLLLFTLVAYTLLLWRQSRSDSQAARQAKSGFEAQAAPLAGRRLAVDALFIVGGLGLLVFGADLLVGSAVGSCIFNICGVAGMAAVAAGGLGVGALPVPPSVMDFDLRVSMAVTLACLPVFLSGRAIARWQGALFLGYYAAYTACLVMRAQGNGNMGCSTRQPGDAGLRAAVDRGHAGRVGTAATRPRQLTQDRPAGERPTMTVSVAWRAEAPCRQRQPPACKWPSKQCCGASLH